jgi:serine/threonine protein kinase
MLGKSLHDLIHGRQSKRRIEQNYLHNAVSFEKKVELLLDVVKGMMYLHGLDPVIVHRDLKPNVC